MRHSDAGIRYMNFIPASPPTSRFALCFENNKLQTKLYTVRPIKPMNISTSFSLVLFAP